MFDTNHFITTEEGVDLTVVEITMTVVASFRAAIGGVEEGVVPLGVVEKCRKDVAGVVTFLASDGARFMTGQAVNVTGGVYMG